MTRSGGSGRKNINSFQYFHRFKYKYPTMKKLIFVLILFPMIATAQHKYKYGLSPMTLAQYKESIKTNPNKELVDLEKFIPDMIMDIRYASENNFTGKKIYNLAKA